jgi:hypothetical protein
MYPNSIPEATLECIAEQYPTNTREFLLAMSRHGIKICRDRNDRTETESN